MKPAEASFPPASRLRVKADFDRVFSRPNQRASQGAIQAIYKPCVPDTSGPRLGLIIAKRFLPLAVQRNRVKRLAREAFRTHRQELPPVDIIVRLVRKPSDEVSISDLKVLFGKISSAK